MIAVSTRKLLRALAVLRLRGVAEPGGRGWAQPSPSVAGLVLVVPPVEVVVEQNDASWGHASNDAPGRSREEGITNPAVSSGSATKERPASPEPRGKHSRWQPDLQFVRFVVCFLISAILGELRVLPLSLCKGPTHSLPLYWKVQPVCAGWVTNLNTLVTSEAGRLGKWILYIRYQNENNDNLKAGED